MVFAPTRQALLTPSAKRREVFGESRKGLRCILQKKKTLLVRRTTERGGGEESKLRTPQRKEREPTVCSSIKRDHGHANRGTITPSTVSVSGQQTARVGSYRETGRIIAVRTLNIAPYSQACRVLWNVRRCKRQGFPRVGSSLAGRIGSAS